MWTATGELDYTGWLAVGQRLGAMGRCSQWWIGDWIRYGNARFGERYARAKRITGYDAQTLMNMVYVASRYEISRRRETLSWSHHETLAALDQAEQDRWLDEAAQRRMSVADLRTALRGAAKERRAEQPGCAADTGVTCPNCGHRLSQS